MRAIFVSAATVFLLAVPPAASAQEERCVKCHEQFVKGAVLHPALVSRTGCRVCHSAIIARSVPHKQSNTIAKGLIATQPDVCYGCHDKGMFSKQNVHGALGAGCTGCHDPHSSENAKLLVSAQPDLCYGCHDKTGFSKNTIHAPVAMGMCLSCHTPHSSDGMALLVKNAVTLCLECHADAVKKQHIDAGSSSLRHPLGETVKTKEGERELKNPALPDKPFYCGSCHNPHSTNTPTLFEFNARSAGDLCTHCHNR